MKEIPKMKGTEYSMINLHFFSLITDIFRKLRNGESLSTSMRYCYTYSERPSLNSGSIHADNTIWTIGQQFQSENYLIFDLLKSMWYSFNI